MKKKMDRGGERERRTPRAMPGRKPRGRDGQRHAIQETEAEGKSHGRPSGETTAERHREREQCAAQGEDNREEEPDKDMKSPSQGAARKHPEEE